MGFARLYRDVTLNFVCSTSVVPRRVRWRLLSRLGMRIEGACTVSPGCWFGGTNIKIGKDSTINYGVFFDNSAEIDIGRGVDVGMEAMFCTSTHEIGPGSRRAGLAGGSPIKVGDGTWIGARVVVLPGVTIGRGCVVAAGSLVLRDCDDNGLYAGSPAKRIRDL